MKAAVRKQIDEILAAPYARVLRRAEEGGYWAEVLEFPGCVSQGETAEETMANLEEAMDLWAGSILEDGGTVPAPLETATYSGNINLRIPPSLHERCTLLARAEDVSLNRLFSMVLSMYAGARSDWSARGLAEDEPAQGVALLGPHEDGGHWQEIKEPPRKPAPARQSDRSD